MTTTTNINNIGPVKPKERSIILDALRGLTLFGICLVNFPEFSLKTFLKSEVTQFLVQGAFVRKQEFIDGNRTFKVIELFLLGFYIGRNRIYANLAENKGLLKKVFIYADLWEMA